jgi:regulator of sigma E protease
MTTIFIFLGVLAILVLVHELGHFITAKRNGVGAEEFGFGFPPRLVGIYKDKNGKRRLVFGNKEIAEGIKGKEETIYSFNLLPLGGFVKITGEDGQQRDAMGKKDHKSFANKSIWIRFKILVAGVTMNFILAIVLFSLAYWLGLPEMLSDNNTDSSIPITITVVAPKSPAEKSGLQLGDKVYGLVLKQNNKQILKINSIEEFQKIIKKHLGKEITLQVKHPSENKLVKISVIPRKNPPAGEGSLGVGLAKTKKVKHSLVESIKLGLTTTYNMTVLIFAFLKKLILSPFTHESVGGDVTGPIGIAKMSGQAAKLGLAFLMQFTAMLSVNLAVINILPFPGLDGGRILFLIIEKLKGSPVKQSLEQTVNTVGFMILLGLMALIVVKDVLRFW